MGSRKQALSVEASTTGSDEEALARTILSPAVQAAMSIERLNRTDDSSLDLISLVDELSKQANAVSKGAADRSEAMLVTQAHTLDALFHALLRRACNSLGHNPETVERYMKLALKAQNQSRCTWQAISVIRNPPVATYVGQANIAHGPQQVNNDAKRSPIAPGSEMENELLEVGLGKGMDRRATQTAS